MSEILTLPIDVISIGGGTQSRVALNQETVADYAEVIRLGGELPPIVVFNDEVSTSMWLADGFHRYHAHRAAGATEVACDVRSGSQRDAVLFSASANVAHGLRRTNEDKRRAVSILLSDEEWSKWSDREIARICGVGNKFVGDVRASICVPNTDAPAVRVVERNGKKYEQNVTNIGKAEPAPALPASLRPATASSGAPVVVPGDEDAPNFDADETVLQPGPVPAPDLHLDAIEEDMTADELLAVEQAEVARLSDEVGQLRARIAVLEQGSDAVQLLALERDRDGYRNTSTDHFNKWAAANKKAIDYKALLDRLCKIAGVSKYSELAARVTPAARS